MLQLILAIYILAITAYPCSDQEICADEIWSGIAVSEHNNHSSGEQDICSPFCVCSCCATHGQVKSVSDVDTPVADYYTSVSVFHIEKPVVAGGYSIWQPPRV